PAVLLVTCADWPEGEPGGHLLVDDLAARGVVARWLRWDDPHVDWRAAAVVAVRSTWDYERRCEEFLQWARAVGPGLLNGAETMAWNVDKAYLLDLAGAGLAVVPTVTADDPGSVAAAVTRFGRAVAKPRVGAGGRGVRCFEGTVAEGVLDAATGPWVVQPLVESVRTEGETSVFVVGGRAAAQVSKRPADGEIRVHEQYGGITSPVSLQPAAAGLAEQTVRVVERLRGTAVEYARVDMLRLADGSLAVSELEAVEPGLYLEVLPTLAATFGAMVERVLAAGRRP
ncbi:MAG: hypothetical protein WB798_08315, partial [Nocardioidaceae bacterium]